MSSSHTQSLNLVGKLDRLLYSGGDLVNCEVNFFMNSEKTAKEEDKWSVVGIVGCIIGQCKLENKQLTTQNQTSPKSLSFSTSDWKYSSNFNFDAVPSFTSTLESKSQLICIIPMHVKSTPDDVAKGSVKLSAYLSYNLSPSVRGTLFKFAYKVVVTVQVKYSNSESKTHIVQLPLRVLPSSTMYHSLRFQECDDMKGKFSRDMLNPFWIPDTRDKNSYFNFGFDGGFSKQTQKSITSLFEEKEVHTTKSAGQIYSALSHIVSQSENPDCSKHSSEDSNKVFVYPNSHSELIDLLARSPPGVTQYTTWTDIKLNCISKLILPFTLPIPTNITPQFHSVSLTSPFISLDYRWRLHLEFELLSDSSKNDLSDHFNGKSCVKKSYGTIWTLPCNLKTEKFLWNIPIQLVHSNTSVIDSFGDAVKHST
ncbi:RAB6A-GEF complex partner protein 2 [Schistosoma japonicum]|nr:RAB6A-GEF complex partner protein 2 [Schistosoma japonicum]